MSEEAKKKPHPFRLAAFMLVGAVFGELLAPVIAGNGPMVWEHVQEIIYAVCGSLAGGALELLVRVVQRD